MSDRRETPRAPRRTRKPKNQNRPKNAPPRDWTEGERIAKYIARAGVASRREVEAMIERGEVSVNGKKLKTPAFKVLGREDIRVNGKRVESHAPVRIWRYHKPAGLLTSTSDPEGRRTIFDELSKSLPRTVTIGRLDLTTEGLLLLTNDGGLAREMELPKTGLTRVYRARAHGKITQDALDGLQAGVELEDGTQFSSIKATLERETGTNNWITIELTEGKNREVRRALEHLGLKVNRLIRIQYGPFELADLRPGAVEEVPGNFAFSALKDGIDHQFLPKARIQPERTSRPGRSKSGRRR